MCRKGWSLPLPKLLPHTRPHLPQIPLHSKWKLTFNFLSDLALRFQIDPLQVRGPFQKMTHPSTPAYPCWSCPPTSPRGGTFPLKWSLLLSSHRSLPCGGLSTLGATANGWNAVKEDKEQICGEAVGCKIAIPLSPVQKTGKAANGGLSSEQWVMSTAMPKCVNDRGY